jgi:hypothetical protein
MVAKAGRKAATAETANTARTLFVDEMGSSAASASSEVRSPVAARVPEGDDFIALAPRTPGFFDDGPVRE